ncbi:MAG: glutamyl-tRNA amidotransferase [gamma proteobacterium symbiont of Ctena orbiculata]|nr:MAG: glutamyl-tRNA amidotransferase [gamma proteobacterium symbiont of Ctena orbiculata]PVV14234.1 MAG: glutamyl-tRNA amidotransferase [gamma proteobacterium symbiont of Ctena orbiculata]PVV25890.1 MAG: glutamyl-tRNA amidotransferase [gamma proteobacterium symbiont of Ctena orbiculata]
MKPIIPLLFIALLSGACQEMERVDMSQLSAEEKKAVETLLWVEDADAEKQAAEALDKGDKRLMAMASRATILPGIEPELQSKAKSICGIRYLDGSTDTVFGEIHLQFIQRATEFAAAYNKIVIDKCMEK